MGVERRCVCRRASGRGGKALSAHAARRLSRERLQRERGCRPSRPESGTVHKLVGEIQKAGVKCKEEEIEASDLQAQPEDSSAEAEPEQLVGRREAESDLPPQDGRAAEERRDVRSVPDVQGVPGAPE